MFRVFAGIVAIFISLTLFLMWWLTDGGPWLLDAYIR